MKVRVKEKRMENKEGRRKKREQKKWRDGREVKREDGKKGR